MITGGLYTSLPAERSTCFTKHERWFFKGDNRDNGVSRFSSGAVLRLSDLVDPKFGASRDSEIVATVKDIFLLGCRLNVQPPHFRSTWPS